MNALTNSTSSKNFGYTKNGKVYLKSALNEEDREIGDVKSTESEAIAYFEKRFDLIAGKVNAMLAALGKAENKGSYLMQVLHLKDSLYTFNAIGPFEELLEKLEAAEKEIMELIEANRIKNLEVKKQLLEKAKLVFDEPDLRTAIKELKDIRFNWLTVGSTSKEVSEELEQEFAALMDRFQELKERYTEQRNIEIEIRKQKLQILIETASKLNTYPPEVEQSFFKMRKLEEEWKAVGNIPKTIYAPLFEEFKRIKKTIAKYARRTQGGGRGFQQGPKPIYIPKYIPPHEEPLYANLRRRMDLIQEAQDLLKLDLRQANELAKDVQARWKTAGQIPDKYKSEIFNQFNAISDRIFESSYLARVVHTKYPHFRTMAPEEQLEAKIEAMDEIILKEDMSVKIAQAEFQFMSDEERNTDENRARFSRLNTSVRKLKMKNKLLMEMKRELDRLRNPGARYQSGGYQRSGGGYQRDSYQHRGSSSYDNRRSSSYGDNRENRGYSDNRESRGYGDRYSGGQRPYNSGGNRDGDSGYSRGRNYNNEGGNY